MKKTYLAIVMIIALCVSIVGCGKVEQNEKSVEVKKMRFEEVGLEYYEPQAWDEKEGVSPACVAGGKYGVAYIVAEIPYEFLPTDFIKGLIKDGENAKTEEDQKKYLKNIKRKRRISLILWYWTKLKKKMDQLRI